MGVLVADDSDDFIGEPPSEATVLGDEMVD